MIALFCLAALLGLGNCLENIPTSRQEIETSINRTINEVERMIEADPSLPRLSRSEIVDILFNITSHDMDSYKDHVERTRENYQRALMVVLPYNSKDSNDETLKDLYTKAPQYEILTDSPESSETIKNESTKSITKSSNSIDTRTKWSEDNSNESINRYKNHRETYTDIKIDRPRQETLQDKKIDSAPEKFTFDLKNFDKSFEKISSTISSDLQNRDKNRSTPSRSNIEIVYSTSVTQRPLTTKTIIHTTENGATTTPTRSTQNVLTSDQWRYNAPPPSTTTEPRKSVTDFSKNHQKLPINHFLPTMITESNEKLIVPSSTSASRVVQLPEDETDFDMANLRILNINEKPAPFYVTPMSSTNSAKLDDAITTANTPKVSKSPMPMREEVQSLLASIGLRPKNEKSSSKKQEQDKIFGTNFQIPDTNDVLRGESFVTAASSSSNLFEKAPEDVRQGVNNLSPDVQLLFQRFGLQTSAQADNNPTKSTTVKPRVATSKTSFWNNFKPLPTSEVKDEGMKDFLAKFGLGINGNRNEKAIKPQKSEEKHPSLIDAVPGNMRQILENIGLIRKTQRRAIPRVTLETTETPQLHVFKPHETSLDDEKQRSKINELLDTVKQVQEGKADVADVQKVAKELLETTKSLKNGPDPLSLEEILKMYNDDVKNEIKRQQDPKDLADMATSETSDISSTTTLAPTLASASSSADSSVASSDSQSSPAESLSINLLTDSRNVGADINVATTTTTPSSNLADLADSFGGSTAAPDPVLPTRRKTGLYFLVDWNTFLEVGEDEKDKVNLRFQPKAGDRTRFLPVTVP